MIRCDDTQRAAEGFAASLGAAVVNRSHINRCVIADVDREMMQGWVDNVHPDYALEWITPDGPYPDASLDDMARLRGVLLNDAPVDDMPIDHRVISHEELRADEARQIGYGRHRWTLIARHLPTGEPVGYTELLIDKIFRLQAAQQPGITDQRLHLGLSVSEDAAHHRVSLGMDR